VKRTVVNVQFMGNACFAWSVIAALHPVKNHIYRESLYPHYSTVLNLKDVEFPITLTQFKKLKKLKFSTISRSMYTISRIRKRFFRFDSPIDKDEQAY